MNDGDEKFDSDRWVGMNTLLDDLVAETNETNTWTYEFPEVLKLFISVSISFVLFLANAVISYFDLYSIFMD